jgi:hypothetical protein
MTLMPLAPSTLSCLDVRRGARRQTSDRLPTRPPLDALQAGVGLGNFPALPRSDGAPIYIHPVAQHIFRPHDGPRRLQFARHA